MSPIPTILGLSHREVNANRERELNFSTMLAKLADFRFASRQSDPLNVS